MPPSGFNQQAINGLLEFVKEHYESTLRRYPDMDEEEALKIAIEDLEGFSKEAVENLPLAMNSKGQMGLQAFMAENFKELIREIHQGKKTRGQAMQAEIENIDKYLGEFTL